MSPSVAPGSVAPDFTLDTTAGLPFTLSAFQGEKSVLLAFFPLAFGSVCTSEMCSFTDDHAAFADRGLSCCPSASTLSPA